MVFKSAPGLPSSHRAVSRPDEQNSADLASDRRNKPGRCSNVIRLAHHLKSAKHRLGQSFKFLKHWALLVTLALALLLIIAAWLWHFPALRPYLLGLATGMAAFLGPLPGLLSPKTRGKWFIAVGVAAVIGLGAWYSSYQLEKERNRLEKEANGLEKEGDRLKIRISLQQEFFRSSVKRLSTDERSRFLIGAAGRLAELYPQPKVDPLLDVISVLNEIDPGNGHAYYFAGEEYRSLADQTNMRGAFQHYLAAADRHPEAIEGDSHNCSERPAGYCGERTALIDHFMARDYYHEALKTSGDRRLEDLRTALNFEQHGLRIWRFNRDGSVESTCELLQGIAKQLLALGQPTSPADSALGLYRSRYGGC